MKRINFVDSIPDNVHREVQLWLLGTTLLFFGGLAAIIGINLLQLPALYRTYQEQKSMHLMSHADTPVVNLKTLQIDHETLQKKVSKLKRYHQEQTDALTYLHTLARSCGSHTHIHTFHLAKDRIELSLGCPDPHHAIHVIQALEKLPSVDHITLASVQTDQSQGAPKERGFFRCTIKGGLVGKKGITPTRQSA